MKKEIVKIIEIYRALEINEHMIMCEKYVSDILSECYSRVLRTSYLYGNPSLRCFTESIKVANKYAKKPGYSGKIAMVEVCIYSDGSCCLMQDSTSFVHRLWKMEDWLDISYIANNDTAINLNYRTGDIKLFNVFSYGGQTTARAYACESKIWVVHTEMPVSYTRILSQEEVETKVNKRSVYPSLNSINYMFDSRQCEDLLKFLNRLDKENAWIRCMKKELENIKEKLCA